MEDRYIELVFLKLDLRVNFTNSYCTCFYLSTGVKLLASKLVEQWLRIVKGETEAIRAHHVASMEVSAVDCAAVKEEGKKTDVCSDKVHSNSGGEECKVDVPALPGKSENVVQVKTELSENKVIQVHNLIVKTEDGSEESPEEVAWDGPIGQLPVYKITIRDGKQVLAKVFSGEKSNRRLSTDSSSVATVAEVGKPVVKVSATVATVSDTVIIKKEDSKKDVEESAVKSTVDSQNSSVVKSKVRYEKLENNVEVSKLNKDVHKKTKDIQLTTKVSDKQKRTKVESSSEKSREKETSKEKSKDKSKDRESNRERETKDKESNRVRDRKLSSEKVNAQSEKDKAALAKLIPPAINKLGKIPKKPRHEEPQSPVVDVKKPSSGDVKKPPLSEQTSRKPSISIESRKSDSARPKTVKTFNSKFRSTGLEEEVKPPPSRSVRKVITPVNKKPVKLPSLKRPSPPKEMSAPPEKKLKPTVADMGTDDTKKADKSGSIKLIPPRPKRKYGWRWWRKVYRGGVLIKRRQYIQIKHFSNTKR
jgi:protein phosphatase 1 regulatory subunit 10